jgi:hypothetical protein
MCVGDFLFRPNLVSLGIFIRRCMGIGMHACVFWTGLCIKIRKYSGERGGGGMDERRRS